MLKTLPTPPGFLFGSFLFRSDRLTSRNLHQLWIDQYGPSESMRPSFNPLIGYYQREMDGELDRFLVVTSTLYPRSDLLTAKLKSMGWENEFAEDGKRSVNIDIGFLSPENFLLATTKNYSHRVFIGHDIFADLTYQFKQGEWRVLPWTYPDYQDPEKMDFLTRARDRLLASFLPMT